MQLNAADQSAAFPTHRKMQFVIINLGLIDRSFFFQAILCSFYLPVAVLIADLSRMFTNERYANVSGEPEIHAIFVHFPFVVILSM